MTDPEERQVGVAASDDEESLARQLAAVGSELEELEATIDNISTAVSAVDEVAAATEAGEDDDSIVEVAADLEEVRRELTDLETAFEDADEERLERLQGRIEAARSRVDVDEIAETVGAADAAVYVDDEGRLRPRVASLSKSGRSTERR